MKNIFLSALFARLAALVLSIFLFLYIADAGMVDATIALNGEVKDTNEKPAAVLIQIFDETGNLSARSKTNSNDGKFYVAGLKPAKKYMVKVLSTEKKILSEKEINTPNVDKFKEISLELKLTQDLSYNK